MGIERLRSAYEAACLAFPDEKKFKPFRHMLRRCEEFMTGLSLEGLNVVEAGAGNGFLTHYLAECAGVKSIEAVDDYEGKGSPVASGEVIARMRELLGNSGCVRITRNDFMKYLPEGGKDCIIFVNVLHHIVNHLIKTAGVARGEAAVMVLKHAAECLREGGKVVFQEFSDRNYCFLPFGRKFIRSVDYKSKIPFPVWKTALEKTGFTGIRLRYRLPLILPRCCILRFLFNNRIASLLTDSSFVVTASYMGK